MAGPAKPARTEKLARLSRMAGMAGLLLVAVGCGQKKAEVPVVMERPGDVSALTEIVKKIELIPLETAEEALFGDMSELLLLGDSFVLWDMRNVAVARFDKAGRFLNRIGREGNGPGEYVGIKSVQADDGLVVFSFPDKMARYAADGTLVRERHVDNLGGQSCVLPEGILTYYGFGTGREERAALLREDGTSETFLETSAKVLNMTPDTPVFSFDGNRVFFTDSYTPTVYVYEKGKVRPEVSFDFGSAAVNNNFYHFDDAMASAEYMMSANEFAMVRRYLHSRDYQIVEVIVQKRDGVEICYGISAGDRWKWFSLGSPMDSPIAGSLRALDGSTVYCLLDPARLAGGAGAPAGPLAPLGACVTNLEVLDGRAPDDNPVIVKIYLK